MAHVHRYSANVRWQGSTGAGYDAYDRTHEATAPPATAALQLASDPAFLGDPARLNPEQLLVLAAASCQLLSFLAVAARARVDVVDYADDAAAEMPEDQRPTRITRIVLHPRIGVRGQQPLDKLERLVQVAHRECYIANSVTTDIVVEPEFTFRS
jgi:organic hydroperoxide reductase OsmC/OhrA